jgi:hypothetical protein
MKTTNVPAAPGARSADFWSSKVRGIVERDDVKQWLIDLLWAVGIPAGLAVLVLGWLVFHGPAVERVLLLVGGIWSAVNRLRRRRRNSQPAP